MKRRSTTGRQTSHYCDTHISFRLVIVALFTATCLSASAQTILQPGFSIPEYLEMLRITGRIPDSSLTGEKPPPPLHYQMVYRSPEVGLVNQWDCWLRADKKVGVISLRGTANEAASWLENFYAAMVPAAGELHINDSTVFRYQLAASAAATVHVGWLTGIAHMAPAIGDTIKSYYEQGVREWIITGHSQGGALSFLLRSWIHYQTLGGALPKEIVYKTYCSAAPKPGNMQYVYDYDFITGPGWSYTVVNALDWVPETPFSLQSLKDFNELNPFVNVNSALKKQPLLARWYLNHAFNAMGRITRRSQKKFRKYLGKVVYKQVRKHLPQFREPVYAASSTYMRAGAPVVLQPDAQYHQQYIADDKNVFLHHMPKAYYSLAQRQYP